VKVNLDVLNSLSAYDHGVIFNAIENGFSKEDVMKIKGPVGETAKALFTKWHKPNRYEILRGRVSEDNGEVTFALPGRHAGASLRNSSVLHHTRYSILKGK